MCCLLKSWLLAGYTTIMPHPFMDTTIFPVPYTARFLPAEKGSENERYYKKNYAHKECAYHAVSPLCRLSAQYYLILNGAKVLKSIRISKFKTVFLTGREAARRAGMPAKALTLRLIYILGCTLRNTLKPAKCTNSLQRPLQSTRPRFPSPAAPSPPPPSHLNHRPSAGIMICQALHLSLYLQANMNTES